MLVILFIFIILFFFGAYMVLGRASLLSEYEQEFKQEVQHANFLLDIKKATEKQPSIQEQDFLIHNQMKNLDVEK